MSISFRKAQHADVTSIIRLLAEDDLGRGRERHEEPLPDSYYAAFAEINRDTNHELIVAEQNGEMVGTLHLMFLPSLSYQGGTRAQIESVRVDKRIRNQGVGQQMMKYAIERARAHGCVLVQLTTHATRKDAHRFYERLGFSDSHVGMKLILK